MGEMGKPFWRELGGLGGWVAVADLLRAGGFVSVGGGTTAISRLADRLGLITHRDGKDVSFVRREDVPAIMEAFLRSRVRQGLRLVGHDRPEILAEVDRPEFATMALPEIFDALADAWACGDTSPAMRALMLAVDEEDDDGDE